MVQMTDGALDQAINICTVVCLPVAGIQAYVLACSGSVQLESFTAEQRAAQYLLNETTSLDPLS